MKRFLALVICLIWFSSTAMAKTFTAGSAYDARMKALDVFDICAYQFEKRPKPNAKEHLKRWERSIHVYVEGKPTIEDRKTLSDFLMELALRVPTLPNITIEADRKKANLFIYYVPQKQIGDYVEDHRDDEWASSYLWWNSWRINKCVVGIASDVTTQEDRNYLLKQQLVASLGFMIFHSIYSDSILYDGWYPKQKLSEVDWIMLNMLYSPMIGVNTGKQSLHNIFTRAWTK